MLKFLIILINVPSLLAENWDAKPWKREELVTTLYRRTPLPIWRRTPPPIFPSRDKNKSVELPIWRKTPPPIFPSRDINSSVELPIWRRTPPPIFAIRDEKIQYKSMNKTDDGKKSSMKWLIKDIYYPKRKDLSRQLEIKNMGRWILRWDLYDKKFKFGKHNRTDYLMYSRWRFLYEPPISNIIDFFKNL